MKHQFQYFFNKDFSSYEDFLSKVLFPIFGENNFEQGYDVLTSRSDIKQKASEANIEEIKHVGTFSTDLAADIKLFEVVLADKSQIERSRTNIQMLIRRYVDTFEGAFMVFRYKNPVNRSWRFSYVEKRSSATDSTSAKRYTYLFGKDYACRTASQRFFELYSLQQSITLQNITDAFSVEALSNEFFHRYRTIYADFIQSINGNRYEKERGKWVENIKHDPDTQFFDVFEEDDKAVRDFVKKLLGRLVFLQFLQKKGWLAVPLNKTWGEGNTNFMQQLFRDSNNKENFLEAVLEPLFFDTLNSEREGHVANPILGENVKIPYLNGGLFERDELDDKKVVFPVYLFEGLFNFFGEYNFTIDENDPTDAELGIDPEMLGRIFENLLEDNKDKGAFYTPKEIVQYMCQQSLLFYLTTDNEAHKTDIEILVLQHKADHIPRRLKQVLITKLEDVKICDPAIGSGAFPMGMMNEIYKCRIALEGDTGNAVEIKRHIIQHNIYGVDIENGAVDIARLRFWLALVVDETEPHPLPNLDYKIMQGNSLLESFEGIDLSRIFKKPAKDEQVRLIFDEESTATELLQKNLSDYFAETSHEKKTEIRQKVNNAVKMLIRAKTQRTDILEKLEFINISANNHFFLWHTWFSDVFEQGGFDIVIGNPPYNELRDLNDYTQKQYKASKYHKYASGGRVNIFQYFYPLGIDMLKLDGIVSLITQNSLLAEDSALNNRKLLFENTDILQIDSFPERDNKKTRVFESVKMSVCIGFFKKIKIDDYPIKINVWKDKYMSSNHSLMTTKKMLKSIYPLDLTIPICSEEAFQILIKLKNQKRIFIINSSAGEIDMTKFSSLFTEDQSKSRVITGAQVLKYRISDTPSQGKVIYIDNKLINLSGSRAIDYNHPRIVMQRITGVDSKIRLIATLINPGYLCANSTNYISEYKNSISLKFLLGIINSLVMNFFFKQTSTNTNVTSKEISKLPILKIDDIRQKPIISLVDKILEAKKENPQANTTNLENQIDILVYKLYNLTYDEVKIIDPDIENIISRKEYESIKN